MIERKWLGQVCKTSIPGSNPGGASNFISSLLWSHSIGRCSIRNASYGALGVIVQIVDRRSDRRGTVNMVVLLIILLLLFGGGGFYLGGPAIGGGLGGIILLVLIVMLVSGRL